MGIRFNCPNGHKLNVKAFLAGKRGICPDCDAKFIVPLESGGTVEAIVEVIDENEPPLPAEPLLPEIAGTGVDGDVPTLPSSSSPVEESLVIQTEGSIPLEAEVVSMHRRRQRQKRDQVKSITLFLGGMIVLLTVVMLVVLLR